MNKELRIVFMGTPDFAVATLKTLVENNYQIVGVITAPDKPAGRGRKIQESAVKTYAKSQGLHIMQPTNLKHDDFVQELKFLEANLQIVVAFRMLPKIVWQMPEYGTFNLHASLLPNYRGAAPINWAIINGETKTGVTTFFIDEKIDTGEMILQKEVAIEDEDNAGTLHDKLMTTGSQLVLETVKRIEQGQVKTSIQKENPTIKDAHKLNKDNCKINWDNDIKTIHNKVRGLNPYPGAWCYLENGEEQLEIKLYQTSWVFDNHDLTIGTLVADKKTLKVAASNGFILVEQIKLPGKRKMDIISLLNGYHFHDNAKML
ncbi:methionyl-tRNA formyltransferase [Hanstruepera ponticola]|uniref:methionyl-tRNA formyltransferase n=1 Tax=Hanstruepera ponticola TaxID=2042995 RepID=UPI000CF03BB6|nr:methionyl-tRNA formyltransferase [Hanstruepera ponticola]